MKKVLMALVVMAAMAASAELKIASVNMMELVTFHPRRADDSKLLKSKDAEYKKRLDEKRDAIDKIEKEFREAQQEAQNPMLTDAAKKATFEKLESLQKRGLAAQSDLRNARLCLERSLPADLRLALGDDGAFTVLE